MSASIGVVMPFWLDRPDEEAVDIAVAAEEVGIETVWVGEMATFDAFALATAIGLRTKRTRPKIGPLAMAARGPVGIAFGVSSVATLIGRPVDVAVGASSPAIVEGWHGRPWGPVAPRMAETLPVLRAILDGARADLDGQYFRARGFRLRRPQPETTITVAAFGPHMTRLASRCADEVVLNLVGPRYVAEARAVIDREARAAGREPPKLAVWVPGALDPGDAALDQLAGQMAVYLRPPGYGEMFAAAGLGDLVARARAGTPRAELAAAIPREAVARSGAIGDAETVVRRIRAFFDAGADHVGLVPATADDAGGRRILEAAASAVLS